MLSNFVFVLLCFCSCNCQTSNQNDNTRKKPVDSEERTGGFGDQPFRRSTPSSIQSNPTFQPLYYRQPNYFATTKAPVAQITDVNASENNFEQAPETIKPTNNFAGSQNSNNRQRTTKATERPRTPANNNNNNNNNLSNNNNQNNNNNNNNNNRPFSSSAPVNSGNNNQQINHQVNQQVNNQVNHQVINNQQRTTVKTTRAPANTVTRPTVSPSQTSNVGFNNEQRQPTNQKPIYEVTTTDPKILFPGEGINIRQKPVSHNRQPVHSDLCDKATELLYPGDIFDDWACDCKPGYLYHPLTSKCWESHRKGPCAEGHILTSIKDSRVPECQRNHCNVNFVYYKNSCYQLGSSDPCPVGYGPRPLILTVDATTLELVCSDLHSLKCDLIGCCIGEHNCVKL